MSFVFQNTYCATKQRKLTFHSLSISVSLGIQPWFYGCMSIEWFCVAAQNRVKLFIFVYTHACLALNQLSNLAYEWCFAFILNKREAVNDESIDPFRGSRLLRKLKILKFIEEEEEERSNRTQLWSCGRGEGDDVIVLTHPTALRPNKIWRNSGWMLTLSGASTVNPRKSCQLLERGLYLIYPVKCYSHDCIPICTFITYIFNRSHTMKREINDNFILW